MQTNVKVTKQERLARAIATVAHHGQFRKDGVTPYITHPEAVAAAVSKRARPAALLHDVCEENPVFCGRLLRDMGVTESTVIAVVYLTHRDDESYADYIQKIRLQPIAVEVKIADIKHNLSCNPSPKNAAKYKEALAILGIPL